ncbi:MAG: HcpC [Yonghaparkia sp.]|nr:HcpC [Microcella sp.]
MSPTARTARLGLALVVVPTLLVALAACTGSTPALIADPTPLTSTVDDGMSGADALQPGPDEVITIGLRFMPEDITVPVGTTVTWRNGESIGHTITSGAWGDVNESTGLRGTQSADGLFDHALAPMGQEGDTFSFTFTEPGEYLYFCQPHLTMNARVIVEG